MSCSGNTSMCSLSSPACPSRSTCRTFSGQTGTSLLSAQVIRADRSQLDLAFQHSIGRSRILADQVDRSAVGHRCGLYGGDTKARHSSRGEWRVRRWFLVLITQMVITPDRHISSLFKIKQAASSAKTEPNGSAFANPSIRSRGDQLTCRWRCSSASRYHLPQPGRGQVLIFCTCRVSS